MTVVHNPKAYIDLSDTHADECVWEMILSESCQKNEKKKDKACGADLVDIPFPTCSIALLHEGVNGSEDCMSWPKTIKISMIMWEKPKYIVSSDIFWYLNCMRP